jgi:integrase/recombinase XerD
LIASARQRASIPREGKRPDRAPCRLSITAGTARVVPQLASEYVDKAAIGKRGACHLFRHTMATLMLEGGADVRFIEEMLGHAKLETTQTYTQVSIRKLKEIHSATHPAARLARVHASPATSVPTDTEREELLASL